ncbi:hypothetical protein PHYPSEUDO_004765 [Phytophthora pseudosyringae]|uniref:BZIP domain-containing protein n=1 Tax=Phytophthora pseudosyringae TaxID=221518 RepID=A0A8T1VNT4_9STRA|nr:hypothetical protein PHYPSEUDO_004765 [Phytophthora pseudosyringae]
MATHDAALLDEVEDFLVSFDLPIFATLHALADGDEASRADTVKAEAPTPVDSTKNSKRRKKPHQVLDPVAKRELEKAKDRKRRSTYRERRRIEKETLQQQVGELTTELAELQRAKEAERSLASSAWEMVAKRQLQGRVNAEEKQRSLLRTMEARAASIQEFQGVLQHGLATVADAANKHKRIRVEPSEAEFYEAYAQDLDNFYAQTDEFLRNFGLDSTDASWDQPRRQWKEDGETGYYVYTDKRVSPFDFQRTCRFTWCVAQMQHRQEDRECFDGMDDPDNTAAFKFRVTHRLKSGRAVSVLQRAVVRQYLKDDRSVVVWRSLSEGEGMFTGMHADECGWCVSIPLPNSPKPSTLTRVMMRHVPMHFSSKATQEVEAKQFTGFVLDTGSEDALEITNRLEKLLLQDK